MSLKPFPSQHRMLDANGNLTQPWYEWFSYLIRNAGGGDGGGGGDDLEVNIVMTLMQNSLKAQLELMKKEMEIPFLL